MYNSTQNRSVSDPARWCPSGRTPQQCPTFRLQFTVGRPIFDVERSPLREFTRHAMTRYDTAPIQQSTIHSPLMLPLLCLRYFRFLLLNLPSSRVRTVVNTSHNATIQRLRPSAPQIRPHPTPKINSFSKVNQFQGKSEQFQVNTTKYNQNPSPSMQSNQIQPNPGDPS